MNFLQGIIYSFIYIIFQFFINSLMKLCSLSSVIWSPLQISHFCRSPTRTVCGEKASFSSLVVNLFMCSISAFFMTTMITIFTCFVLFFCNHFEELQTLSFEVELMIKNVPLRYVYPNTIETSLTPNHLLFRRQLLYSSNTTSTAVGNLTVFSSTTDNALVIIFWVET